MQVLKGYLSLHTWIRERSAWNIVKNISLNISSVQRQIKNNDNKVNIYNYETNVSLGL